MATVEHFFLFLLENYNCIVVAPSDLLEAFVISVTALLH
jgi:hypothetical protein